MAWRVVFYCQACSNRLFLIGGAKIDDSFAALRLPGAIVGRLQERNRWYVAMQLLERHGILARQALSYNRTRGNLHYVYCTVRKRSSVGYTGNHMQIGNMAKRLRSSRTGKYAKGQVTRTRGKASDKMILQRRNGKKLSNK